MTIQRRGRRADAAHSPIQQLPWSQPTLTLEPSRILSDDQIETILDGLAAHLEAHVDIERLLTLSR